MASSTVIANQASDAVAPETPTGWETKKAQQSKEWMVTAANPIASQYAAQVLNDGGNAVDAMVVTQLVLGLVEPQSSGIGGGAFLVYWDGEKKNLTTFDARETAPLAVKPEHFIGEDGQPLKFYDAVVSGLSVGTPGAIKLLWEMHQKHGSVKWPRLIEPVIELAEQGFTISPRLASLIERDKQHLSIDANSKAYFLNADGSAKQAGEVLINQAYADTLRLLATYGENAFYQGDIANDIVTAVANHPKHTGVLAKKDLARYEVIERTPICVDYLEYDVCGMGPPSSGGIAVGQILKLSEQFPLHEWGSSSVKSYKVIGDATQLAFADRAKYLADSDFVSVPSQGLINEDYLKQRAEMINLKAPLKSVSAGSPPWEIALNYANDQSIELPSTTHFNIVDAEGNVVSLTSSVENVFGSRIMVRGFLLNNQMTDFSFKHHQDGQIIANHIAPGKRPRSSMSPTIVLKNGSPYLSIGSPGGSYIIGYVAQALIAHLTWQLPLDEVVQLPHISNRFGTVEFEQDTSAQQYEQQFKKWGYKTKLKPLNSGLHIIKIEQDLTGVADPRREGVAIGENQMVRQ
ncbi:gamma-glutamyltransferase [Vibrio breoganii]|uniref:gamma-glutamyltransferase n=1 Tax=Vibrio breoganii TaxID=553239 RepID=UPI000363DBB7|nr:gamma-glutamyltransferase [Vibrio breoganii]OED92519.1 gamma-glutamyltransferase [Vibrio breoganii ZF-29]OEF85080.1 gamma-glutamyltransferase [Vibrio breoganii 1C10]